MTIGSQLLCWVASRWADSSSTDDEDALAQVKKRFFSSLLQPWRCLRSALQPKEAANLVLRLKPACLPPHGRSASHLQGQDTGGLAACLTSPQNISLIVTVSPTTKTAEDEGAEVPSVLAILRVT